MKNILVYLGPTLSITEAKSILPNAKYIPPVKCGDIIKAVEQQPDAIAIIDGNFEQVGAVWHKEILYALDRGISVFGASSMGALRAAECCQFGMIGVGKIFELYSSGKIIDDDEVAIVHTQNAHLTQNTPLVNIRVTLHQALSENIISKEIMIHLINVIKEQSYFNRNVYTTAQREGLTELYEWLQSNYIDQKKLDAVELLQLLSKKQLNTSKKLKHNFNNTLFFKKLKSQILIEASYTLDSPINDHQHMISSLEAFLELLRKDTLLVETTKVPKLLFIKAYLIYSNNYHQYNRIASFINTDSLAMMSTQEREIYTVAFLLNNIFSVLGEAGLSFSNDYVQRHANSFRKKVGALSAAQTKQWMKAYSVADDREFTSLIYIICIICIALPPQST